MAATVIEWQNAIARAESLWWFAKSALDTLTKRDLLYRGNWALEDLIAATELQADYLLSIR